MTKSTVLKFQKTIWDYYRKHGRHALPWRMTHDPYKILVSEIMLQQTQVARVIPKYKNFLKAFPTVKKLANASVAKVVTEWQGLGYNRRALNLQKACKKILEKYGGSLPPAVAKLLTLPGVGKATAGAVAAYAFNLPEPFIETNIRRVYIYHFFKNRKNPVGDNELLPYIYKTLDTKNSRQWFYALTDYGAQLPKVTENPNRFSKHYSKQSAFEGSFRQLRGYILKYLTGHGSQTMQKLAKGSGRTLAETKKAVQQLVAEGFVHIRDSAVMLQ